MSFDFLFSIMVSRRGSHEKKSHIDISYDKNGDVDMQQRENTI